MEEIGLFPLGIVLLPSELVPLHVFEERYKELVGECLEHDREFGLLYADDDGVRETGTRARVTEVLERFEDGRLDIVAVGGERFHVERLTGGRSFLTAEVQPVDDRWDEPDPVAALRAVEAFRALAAVAGAEFDDPDVASPALSFDLAARVEIVAEAKQQLLELRSEAERLSLVADLLDAAREAILAARRLGDHAKTNGKRPSL